MNVQSDAPALKCRANKARKVPPGLRIGNIDLSSVPEALSPNSPAFQCRVLRPILVTLFLCLLCLPTHAAPKVTVIELHGTLWPGASSWAVSQMDKAWQDGAAGIVLDMDTTGGTPDAAEALKSAVLARAASGTSVAVYVHDRAVGPGCLVAAAARTLALSPGASLGNAPPGISKSDLRAAAEAAGRNPAVAAAFVSADAPLYGAGAGQPLTLTARTAQAAGYADVVASGVPDVVAKMGLGGAQITDVSLDGWTAAALWIARPWPTILLLALGLALVIAEMLTLHSWGLAGIGGGILVLLIFAAYITVGAATGVGLLLFLLGIGLLLLETHVFPGHGLSALGGLVLIFLGMFLALGGAKAGAIYPAGAALLTTVGAITLFFLYLPRSKVWSKLGQPGRQTAAAGYVSSDDYTAFVGHIGTASTALRPSGTAEVDGVRLPVVSEGDFVPAGTPVQVVLVQGGRVVVRAA